MIALGQRVVRLLSLVFINPSKIKECERPTGPERSLDDWREDIVRNRTDILNMPGLYLDRSPTGSGKSTADIDAVRQVERALIVSPTHENGSEIEDDMQAAGIRAGRHQERAT